MINQIIFNQLINPNVGGLYYKLLLKIRSILLVLNPNATIQYSYNNIVLTFPFSHDYALNRKEVPLYSENLGVVSKIVLSKYKDARAVDVGANIGDSAAIIIQNLMSRLHKSDIHWQLSDDEILEKRLDWARKSIKDIKRIEARYFEGRVAE